MEVSIVLNKSSIADSLQPHAIDYIKNYLKEVFEYYITSFKSLPKVADETGKKINYSVLNEPEDYLYIVAFYQIEVYVINKKFITFYIDIIGV